MKNMISEKRFNCILLGFAALFAVATGSFAAESRPNILLILSDDHSFAHLGCYGNGDIRTPNLDRLAADGMRFDRAYVTCPQCVPSRASIMTGRSPIAIGMTRFSAPLPAEVKTYPETLRAGGYFTGVAGRNHHLNGSPRSPEEREILRDHKLMTMESRFDYCKVTGRRPEMLAQFREFLDSVPKGKPFFMQLCSNDPHRPYDTSAIAKPHDPANIKLPPHFPDTPKVRADFANYYDEIARLDGWVGKALAELDKRGLADNTLIAFMGDNGAALLRGKGTLCEFGIHVPLIMRWPGVIKPGSTSDALISGEDLAPTFLQAAAIEPPKEMTGRSFLPLLKGESYDARKYVFSERGAHGNGLPLHSAAFDAGRAVVGPRYKLIYNAIWQIPYTPVDFAGNSFWKDLQERNAAGKLSQEMSRLYFSETRPMFEFYDLQTDPAEMNNLIDKPESASIAAELKKELAEWMILEHDFLPHPLATGAADAGRARAKQ
jgi:arylsulfatase A-like enzyme